jgi:acetyl-CoA carboxylase biotin carboxyl carrier protein
MPESAERGERSRKAKQDAASSGGAELNGNRGAGAPLLMDLDFVRGLIDAVDQSGIDSLEINRAGTRIRIAKTPPAAAVTMAPAGSFAPAAVAQPATPSSTAPAAAATAAPAAPASAPAAAAVASNLFEVKSPMVGTFYRAPAPEAPAYAELGTAVTKGQTLCILEAMKLMNELESEVDGIVREILVNDADPIEYGQVLFRIEPAGGR